LLKKIFFVFKVSFKITRNDGREDYITACEFNKYEEAYDFIEKELGICCSDVDFENNLIYEIREL